MEQQCKIGGESLRNRNSVNEDIISELPEALLLQILSSVPTETVIATSVLSKRWRSLWKMVPNLKFDSYYHHTFSENVYRCLILHKAPFLESLRLKIKHKADTFDLGILIGAAFAHHVRKLVLNIQFYEDNYVRFPRVLCSCNNTLEFLIVKFCVLLDFPYRVCLASLKKLHLHFVLFNDDASVCNLLCGCPNLEDLVIYRGCYVDVETFTIVVPSLQRLTIYEDKEEERDGGFVINAPSLKYLSINTLYGLGFCLIENAPELVEAEIHDVSNITNEKILESLTSVKSISLHLSPLEIKYPTGIIFCQLLSLELCTGKIEWWNLLTRMLDSSPKLQNLKLSEPCFGSNKDCPVGWKWSQPKCVPECLLYHLESFVWTRYEWQRDDENEVATYILKNARRLKKASFSTKPIEAEEIEKLETRRVMLNELASVVRASSNSCHLVFKSE
ncbi:hypothetical protein EUTSA_v10011042mg [Eutrema salsugineum]|uniref:F-box domain-containing protein n=1 Tax=Eutrema salsugineum TaxID=72664 RepID=V4NHI1_EUTSA|nr:FBD-associated F-box protein At3g49020 [Eutrema salsugineum]ESQ45641.1 hypothetical protein EUTSA_v10011042mg [Eutrema salsugineum]